MKNILRGFKSFNLAEIEEKVLKFWEENKIFEKSLQKTKKGEPFTFYDGPPFATGLPHYGHILASTIKDVIPRYQTMKGRFVRRRWGWDCHGLPIEEIVERSLGISGKKEIEKIGIGKFNATCRSKVLQFVNEWGKMVRRLARWVDFDNSYKTMDTSYMESVWWAFKEIYDKKLVYEGRKVLMYCPRCETPVSNFEVAMDNSYKDVTEEAVTVKFPLKPGQKYGRGYVTKSTAYLLAWTTTPWTLPANVALAVGKNINYTALRIARKKELYIVASELVKKVFGEQELEIVHDDIRGKDLIGTAYDPLFDVPAVKSKNSYKVYPADFVTTSEGTGIVHTAVVYGEEDYKLGQKVGLPVVPLLDEKGIFNERAPEFLRGKYFKKADQTIIENLEKRKLLFKREKYTHSYPHCWRCETPLFYNAIPAWFINIQKIKKKIIDSNKKEINWFPEHLKRGRYENSVKDAPDWNISRNRYWGNPIPIWRCNKCGKMEAVGSIEEMSAKSGRAKNKYWALRHGESETQLKQVVDSGQKNYHLTTIGQDQVRQSVEKFKKELHSQGEKIDLIFSSDIPRARESADIAAKILGVEKVVTDKRLREIYLADLSGRHPKEYHQAFPTYESRFIERPSDGESLRDVRARVWSLLKELEEKYRGKNILIVSHEYPIWMLFHVAFGWTEEQAIMEKIKKNKVGERVGYGGMIDLGEIVGFDFKILPRNEGGEVDLHRPYIDEVVFSCSNCGGKSERIKEIFDSWFEAGSMPFAEYHYPFENKEVFKKRFPAQFVAEYIAQTRAWFYVMHVVSLILFGKAPFQNVVTTGTILAEDGSKMSKSKGNFPDPWDVIRRYGVDALRFYLMNSKVMQADDLNFSEKEVEKIYRKNVLILWNVYRYFETYSHTKKSTKLKNILDVWIKARTKELINTVTKYLDIYDTVRATRVIEEYINDLSTWYLRRSRSREDAGFFETLQESLIKTSQVIAPFMPYLAEVIYKSLVTSHQTSVHLTDWPKAEKLTLFEKSILKGMEEVRRLASLALAKRAEVKIKVRQPLARLRIRNRKLKDKNLLAILKEEVNVKEVVFDSELKDEIELETEITHELKEEGWLREFLRLVQGLRKDAGLEPKDKIILLVEVPDELRYVVGKNESSVKKKLGARAIEYRRSEKFDVELETKIDEWPVWIALRKPR